MDADQEIRLRCLEAAAKNPTPHAEGYAAGVLDAARQYSAWVKDGAPAVVPEPPKVVERPVADFW